MEWQKATFPNTLMNEFKEIRLDKLIVPSLKVFLFQFFIAVGKSNFKLVIVRSLDYRIEESLTSSSMSQALRFVL